MKADLLDLLRRREIIHPSRITAVEAAHRELRVTVAGFPWWRETTGTDEDKTTFSFGGIKEGLLDAATLLDMEYNEALEVFSVFPLAEQEWADGRISYNTYCSQPLAEPLRLYALVEDYLWEAGAPRSARDYLNTPHGTLLSFCELAQTSSYLVSRAPKQLQHIISAELTRQGVKHNIISNETRATNGLFVQMGGTSFICESAIIEI